MQNQKNKIKTLSSKSNLSRKPAPHATNRSLKRLAGIAEKDLDHTLFNRNLKDDQRRKFQYDKEVGARKGKSERL